MFSKTDTFNLTRIAGFRQLPEYEGSIHDTASARQYGYRRALVPGVILYGYLADTAAHSWGLEWVERGIMWSRSRRPVYEGDKISISASAVHYDSKGKSVDFEIRDVDNNLLVVGGASVPSHPTSLPDLAQFPILPLSADPPSIDAGELKIGDRFGCTPTIMSPACLADSREIYSVTWPPYKLKNIIHPVYYAEAAANNALASYKFPSPSIFVSAKTYHIGIAYADSKIETSGHVVSTYQKNGNYYSDQKHVVFANNTAIAIVERTSIYSARRKH